jgi:hypothetical protein
MIKVLLAILTVLLACDVSAKDDPAADAAIAALRGATNVVLYSVDPEATYLQPTVTGERLRGTMVLGKIKLTGKQVKTAINAAISVIEKGRGSPGAHCFNPRLALRAISGGQTQDYLICFECGWVSVIRNDEEIARLGITGSSKDLVEMLKRANIPLATAD